MNTTLILTAMLCLQLPANDSRPVAADKQPPRPLSLAMPILASRKVEAELRWSMANQRISLDVTDQPLVDLVRHLAKKSGVPMRLDRIGLEKSGILPDEPITARYVDLPIGRVLNRCLEDLDATWLVRDETVLIVTDDTAPATRQMKLIEVSRLLGWIQQNTALVDRDRFGRIADVVGRRLRSSAATTIRAERELADIVTLFGSGFWQTQPGGIRGRSGSVSFSGGVAVIRQTPGSLNVATRLVELLQHVTTHPHQPTVWYVEEKGFGTPASLRVVTKLQQKTTIDCVDTPLEDFIDLVRRESGVRIHLDIVSLEEAGILVDEPVTLRETTASFHSILSTVLGDLDLVHLPRDNGLFVTTADLGFGYHVSAVFDVRDLVSPDRIPRLSLLGAIMRETSGQWEDTDPGGVLQEIGGLLLVRQNLETLIEVELLLHDLRDAASHRAQAPDESNHPLTPPNDTRFYRLDAAEQVDALREAIISFVFPDRWETNGGTGFMRAVGTTLVVRQSPEVHKAIAEFIAELHD